MVPAQRPAPAGDQNAPGTEPPRAGADEDPSHRSGETGPRPPVGRPPNRWREGLRAESGPPAEQPDDRGAAEPGAAAREQSRIGVG